MDLSDYFEGLDWVDQAECRGTEPNIWFPDVQGRGDSNTVRLAKQVCTMCKVQPKCLEYALVTNQQEGIWGGLGPKDRERLRKKRRKAQKLSELSLLP